MPMILIHSVENLENHEESLERIHDGAGGDSNTLSMRNLKSAENKGSRKLVITCRGGALSLHGGGALSSHVGAGLHHHLKGTETVLWQPHPLSHLSTHHQIPDDSTW